MPLLIGTDEAGYGPNLGPLVISATAWQIDQDCVSDDLYDLLREVISSSVAPDASATIVPVADSKVLYNRARGLARLESSLFTLMGAAGLHPHCWREAWALLAPGSAEPMSNVPWYRDFDCPIPLEAIPLNRMLQPEQLREQMEARGVRLRTIQSAVAFPGEFNAWVHRLGGKGAVLSRLTLSLVQRLLDSLPNESAVIHCDKHGGRNRYLPMLQMAFPDRLITVQHESRELSQYAWESAGNKVLIRFVAKGERFASTALASMASKYLRELAMHAFNRFWMERKPGLKPTAGYPVDAKRFKREIAALQQQLGVPDEILWRSR